MNLNKILLVTNTIAVISLVIVLATENHEPQRDLKMRDKLNEVIDAHNSLVYSVDLLMDGATDSTSMLSSFLERANRVGNDSVTKLETNGNR